VTKSVTVSMRTVRWKTTSLLQNAILVSGEFRCKEYEIVEGVEEISLLSLLRWKKE
jgi:hypothetical protein